MYVFKAKAVSFLCQKESSSSCETNSSHPPPHYPLQITEEVQCDSTVTGYNAMDVNLILQKGFYNLAVFVAIKFCCTSILRAVTCVNQTTYSITLQHR